MLKLRQKAVTAVEHDRRHWKAAKVGFPLSHQEHMVTQALIFVMPLLGFGHILTMVVKPTVESLGLPLAMSVFKAVEAVIVSSQGFVISLPYCFFNSEVQGVVWSHWVRWRMVRTVGRATMPRTSLATSTTYCTTNRTNIQVTHTSNYLEFCRVFLIIASG